MTLVDRGAYHTIDHRLATHVLTGVRDAETDRVGFRAGLVKLGRICGYDLVDALFETEPVPVTTPVASTTAGRVPGLEDVVVVSVLRAAMPFVEGLLEAVPAARQGVVSASRREDAERADGTFPVAVDYRKVPDLRPADTVLVADPMLATGSTMCAVLDALDGEADPRRVVALSVVAAPEGLERVREAHPEATLVTVAVDEELDDRGYIVPGLGDAGDRAFGTD